MIFLSTEPNAELVEIEYFIDKKLARTNVTLEQWNKHFHDHQEEVASGRVQVLDVPPEKAQALAEVGGQNGRDFVPSVAHGREDSHWGGHVPDGGEP